MNQLMSTLTIHDLALPIFIGWTEAERKIAQTLILNIEIDFNAPPSACETDDLKDTFCYDRLITLTQDQTRDTAYRLIEHFAAALYLIIKHALPEKATVTIHVIKQPKIAHFSGHVSFSYGDKVLL